MNDELGSRNILRRCDSCDIDLTDGIVLSGGRAYCCIGCADGGPCSCSYNPRHGKTAEGGDPMLIADLLALLAEGTNDA